MDLIVKGLGWPTWIIDGEGKAHPINESLSDAGGSARLGDIHAERRTFNTWDRVQAQNVSRVATSTSEPSQPGVGVPIQSPPF